MIELIENYNNSLKAIYEHVGFVKDWVVCPIDDLTDKYWEVNEVAMEVRFGDTADNLEYCDEIYTQRFYKKYVYRGKEITMIFTNPQVDGIRYFSIFDNKKEVKCEDQ